MVNENTRPLTPRNQVRIVQNQIILRSGIAFGAMGERFDEQLIGWSLAEAAASSSITRNGNGVVTAAALEWPDGSAGTLTVTRGCLADGTDTDDTDEANWVAPNTLIFIHAVSGKNVTVTITRDSSTTVTNVVFVLS